MPETKKVITVSAEEVNAAVLKSLGLKFEDIEFLQHHMELKDNNGDVGSLTGSISVNRFAGNISITLKSVEVHVEKSEH